MADPDVAQLVRFKQDNGVATITFDRPAKLNAITVDMGKRVHALIHEVNHDDSVAALLVLGAGESAFCVGTDLAGFDQYGDNWHTRNRISDYALDFYECRKPVVAAIHGYCIGGGLEVALNCDIRIAAASASFGAGEIKLGWHGGSGTTQFLPRLVGYGKALQMLLTGDPIDAEEALRCGLVQELVPEDELHERGRALAATIASRPPIATQMAKHAVRMALSTGLAVGLAYENDLFSYCMTTQDAAEGRAAFLEKRDPVFRGV